MILVITSITLKSPWKFFPLSHRAMNIVRQMKGSPYIAFQKKGFWTTHYTMSLWPNIDDMKKFSHSGAHMEAIKKTKTIAEEVRTLTIEANDFPKWKEAKLLLKEKGKIIRYE
nr:DUF3291 domain-containing protein [uncultured Allomuricauda sp.]